MIKQIETQLDHFDGDQIREWNINCINMYYDIATPIWNNCKTAYVNTLKSWEAFLNMWGFRM